MSEEQAQWTMNILQKDYDELRLNLKDEKARADAAERHIETLCDEARQLMSSNREFAQEIDRLEDKVQAADEALRNALRLISYLIKDRSDD